MKKNRRTKEYIYSIGVILFIIDQLIKMIIRKTMAIGQEITIIPSFFSIHYVENTGAAFSILRNKSYLFVILATLFLLGINHYIEKNNIEREEKIPLGLIIGGILGNMIDRIAFHSVTDYLSFTFFSYSFAIFNIADMAIVIGIFLYLWSLWKEEKGKEPGEVFEKLKEKQEKKTKRKNTKKERKG